MVYALILVGKRGCTSARGQEFGVSGVIGKEDS